MERLRGVEGCVDATLDIGLSRTRVCVSGDSISIGGRVFRFRDVEPSDTDRVVVAEVGGDVYEVVLHREYGFYKLKAVGEDVAPTLEINGIHMHRIKDVDPWRDTLYKVRAARVGKGDVVLDTCMGLGYTAIASIMRGAREVYTFEVDENVVWIAERNPWSKRLEDPRMRIALCNIVEAVKMFRDNFFSKVIHDPPRFTKSTGYLYSLEFYRELYRVLKPGGILFHYTGEPRRHGAPDIVKGIKNRLIEAGFYDVVYDEKALGFVAYKNGF